MKSLYCFLGGVSISIFISLFINNTIQSNRMRHIEVPIPHYQSTEIPALDMVQLDCMARNIFFEARGESVQGKAMVGLVVLERTKSPHFPQTICGVVTQAEKDTHGLIIKNKCQFSWFCDNEDHTIDFHNEAVAREWKESYIVAEMVMLGKIKENVDMSGVTHYHNGTVKPFWAKNKNYKLVAHIGGHLFYRWKKALLPRWQAADTVAMN